MQRGNGKGKGGENEGRSVELGIGTSYRAMGVGKWGIDGMRRWGAKGKEIDRRVSTAST